MKRILIFLLVLPAICNAEPTSAPAPVAYISSGNTAWMIVATALVMLMTIPGLALFYGGLVRSKNILNVLMQCFIITAVVSLEWVIFWSIVIPLVHHRDLWLLTSEGCIGPF